MKSAILDKGEESYTDISKVFQAIGNEQLKYNWLITGCECYPQNSKLVELFSQEYIWISGEELTQIIQKENFQFIWGVFSGFSKNIVLEEVLKYDLPFADGYEGFWIDDVIIQHSLADIEIVAWDSSLTLFISKVEKLVRKFRCSFPLSDDLSARNTKENFEIAHIEELLIKELVKRNIDINEITLHHKYLIWNKLYSKKNTLVKNEDILHCIKRILKKHQMMNLLRSMMKKD